MPAKTLSFLRINTRLAHAAKLHCVLQLSASAPDSTHLKHHRDKSQKASRKNLTGGFSSLQECKPNRLFSALPFCSGFCLLLSYYHRSVLFRHNQPLLSVRQGSL